eukprot:m.283757 g.283757  ORF g.283757 m.283757 type:complete len:85 (+) comp27008_c1_seq1:1440-1694(+)
MMMWLHGSRSSEIISCWNCSSRPSAAVDIPTSSGDPVTAPRCTGVSGAMLREAQMLEMPREIDIQTVKQVQMGCLLGNLCPTKW